MKAATYTAITFCKAGSCALLLGVQHPNGIGPDVVTTPVQWFDPVTGVIETMNTRYTKALRRRSCASPRTAGIPAKGRMACTRRPLLI